MFLFLLVLLQFPDCQDVNTEVARVTCAHCKTVDDHDSVRLEEYDLQFFKVESGRPLKKISGKVPAYFVDRRGSRHDMAVRGTLGLYWKTDVCFFSGESGSACYDENDNVCGVVLGNVLIKGVWYGRVAKLSKAIDAITGRRARRLFDNLGVD